MDLSQHGTHIARHLEQLSNKSGVDEILELCGFRLHGDAVSRRDGQAMANEDCQAYLQAVETVMGSSVSSFARVNFILAGCPAVQ